MTVNSTPDPAPVAPRDGAQPLSHARVPFPLQRSEQVLAIVRRHWWFLWPRTLLWAGIAIVAPVVAWWLLDLIGVFDDISAIFWIALLLWVGFWGVRILLNWYQYYNDIWVITDQRIVDSRKPHPLRHTLASADLVNIQDMTVEKRGLFASLMNFGDVVCQTAAAKHLFVLSGIPQPAEVQLLVDAERDRERMRSR